MGATTVCLHPPSKEYTLVHRIRERGGAIAMECEWVQKRVQKNVCVVVHRDYAGEVLGDDVCGRM